MFKKLLLAFAAFIATMGIAFAQVDVNKADQAALDGVKGIGPATAKLIIEERKKGDFKDWADFEKRVKGVGEKRAAKLSQNGLTVNGQSLEGAAPSASAKEGKKAKADKAASAKKDEPVKGEKGTATTAAPAASGTTPASSAPNAPTAASSSAPASKKK